MGVCCWHNYSQESGCPVCGQHLAIHGGPVKGSKYDLFLFVCSWQETQVQANSPEGVEFLNSLVALYAKAGKQAGTWLTDSTYLVRADKPLGAEFLGMVQSFTPKVGLTLGGHDL
jgi:hypothetical protein